jgi:hypothetical protein
MSIIGSNILAGAAGSGVSAYEIEQSLRFAGGSSDYFSRSVSGLTTQGGISFWIKFHRNFPNVSGEDPIFAINTGFSFARNYDARWYYRPNSGGGGDTSWDYRKARDESAWYHVFLKFNSASSTSLYLNGVLVDTQAYSITTSGGTFWIGRDNGGTYYAQYYLAEFHAAFGESLDATDFGEFDDNGVWRPIQFTGSYGSDGFYLKFDPSATNGLGHDHSGNGNNFTSGGGFTTSGTGTDVMSDTPTTNWCTLNPLDKDSITLANGNLEGTHTAAAHRTVRATFAIASGKWYWEITSPNAAIAFTPFYQALHVGIAKSEASLADHVGSDAYGWAYWNPTGDKFTNGSSSSYGSTWNASNTIGVAFDADNGTLTFYRDNVSQGTAFTGLTSGPYFPAVSAYTDSSVTVVMNFGQRDFEYTPPTGFKALNTSTLSAPSIKDGSDYFNTVLYTGNATGRTITGVGFQADFLWNKLRDTGAQDHLLYDTVRGIGSNGNYVRLRSNTATAEEDPATTNQDLTAFTSDGFTIGTHAALNGNNQAYVTWLWKAGGSGSSNTAGSITSTVSANPTAGFSIATFTGNGSTATVGHGLGVAPRLVIVRKRSGGTMGAGYSDWCVYSQALVESSGQSDAFVYLNSTAAKSNSSSVFGSAPTSTVFNIGNNQLINNSGSLFVAYCFAEVEGYSKMGTYTGSTGFPFVWCGFKPAFILLKPYDLASGWYMYDTARGKYNVVSMRVLAESAGTETSAAGNDVDILSNGFKLRGASNSGSNYNGINYIFYAVAENPFGGDGVSPATAR